LSGIAERDQSAYECDMAKVTTGDRAPDIVVHDTAGTSLHLSEIWGEHVLVLVFLRHFG